MCISACIIYCNHSGYQFRPFACLQLRTSSGTATSPTWYKYISKYIPEIGSVMSVEILFSAGQNAARVAKEAEAFVCLLITFHAFMRMYVHETKQATISGRSTEYSCSSCTDVTQPQLTSICSSTRCGNGRRNIIN